MGSGLIIPYRPSLIIINSNLSEGDDAFQMSKKTVTTLGINTKLISNTRLKRKKTKEYLATFFFFFFFLKYKKKYKMEIYFLLKIIRGPHTIRLIMQTIGGVNWLRIHMIRYYIILYQKLSNI